jgi:LysM repeat protein
VEPGPTAEEAPQSVEDPASQFNALTTPAPTPAVAREETITYTVQPDDTLLYIAEMFGLRAETLVWANALANSDLILVGQKLRVPPLDGLFYTIQPGDRLADIAFRHGLESEKILKHNRVADPDVVIAGTELFLPGARPVAPATVVAAADPPSEASEGTLEAAAVDLSPLPENLDSILNAGWLRTTGETALYKDATRGARTIHGLPPSVRLERVGGMDGRRVMVRDPGDGASRQAMTGWVDVSAISPGSAPAPWELPRAYPLDTRMDISHVFVPYRSQLDGGPWSGANCGPAALSMVLASFGVDMSPARLRSQVLARQGMYGNYVGTLLTALAGVAEAHGLKALDLYEGDAIKRWSLDDIRAHLQAGHAVLAQVYLRRLPGSERVPYFADHYIVITGAVDDGFLYNDPLNSDGPGWDRLISAQRLWAAMDASDKRYRYAAFAATRGA